MKHFLLAVLSLLSVTMGLSQVANPAPNINQCNLEIFNLTAQTPIILGSQSPSQYTVTYHVTASDAASGVNPIANPQAYVPNQMQRTIYARVKKNSDNTYATTSFVISWVSTYVSMANVSACGSYVLPVPDQGNYYTAPNGTGSLLPAGTVITASQILYLYVQSGACTGQDDFTITITNVTANQPTPLYSCNVAGNMATYNLTTKVSQISPQNYQVQFFTTLANAQAGAPAITNPNSYVSADATIYARVKNGNCYAITTLELKRIDPNTPAQFIQACGSYTLPSSPGTIYSQSTGGSGPIYQPGDIITESIVLNRYSPDCNLDAGSLSITIIAPQVPSQTVYACGSYSLPVLPQGLQYRDQYPDGPIVPAGTVVNGYRNFVVAENTGTCNFSSTITVIVGAENYLQDGLTRCDQDGNGAAVFHLSEGIEPYVDTDEVAITFHLSESDAQAGINPLPNVYTNEVYYSQTIYARIAPVGQTCTFVRPFVLTAQPFYYNYPEFAIGACDSNNDGIFTLNSMELMSLKSTLAGGGESVTVSLFATEQDALAMQSEINITSGYTNSAPGSNMLYARAESGYGCFYIVPVTVTPDVNCTGNTVTGTVSLNTGSGCANGAMLSSIPLTYTQGSNTLYAYPTAGVYTFYDVPAGTGTVTVLPVPGLTAPAPVQVTFAESDSVTANFCLTQSSNTVNDVAVSGFMTMPPRPGETVPFIVAVNNVGGAMTNGTVAITYDSTKMSFGGPTNVSESTPGTLVFNYTCPNPGQQGFYTLLFDVLPPPTASEGDLLQFTVTLQPTGSDTNMSNNTSAFTAIVVNSFDPNDISVREGEFITPQQAQDYLYYTVRFQNEGSAPAINVFLEQTLDDNLDWNTFQPVVSSHMPAINRHGNRLKYTFANINLAPMLTNEAQSSGYAVYRIKPKTNVAVGDSMAGMASILFDYNFPIATNTVTTTVTDALSLADGDAAAGFRMYPNPASGAVTILHAGGAPAQVAVTDILGKTVLSQDLSSEGVLNVSSLRAGIYFVKVTVNDKASVQKLIVK